MGGGCTTSWFFISLIAAFPHNKSVLFKQITWKTCAEDDVPVFLGEFVWTGMTPCRVLLAKITGILVLYSTIQKETSLFSWFQKQKPSDVHLFDNIATFLFPPNNLDSASYQRPVCRWKYFEILPFSICAFQVHICSAFFSVWPSSDYTAVSRGGKGTLSPEWRYEASQSVCVLGEGLTCQDLC